MPETLRERYSNADSQMVLDTIIKMHGELFEAEQILGKVLYYPLYCHDQENFPGTTEKDGVCTGDQTVVSLATEAARLIEELREDVANLEMSLRWQ